MENYAQLQILEALAAKRLQTDAAGAMIDDNFNEDGLFPTFEADGNTQLELIPAEILEPATIAGYVQTNNPRHTSREIPRTPVCS